MTEVVVDEQHLEKKVRAPVNESGISMNIPPK